MKTHRFLSLLAAAAVIVIGIFAVMTAMTKRNVIVMAVSIENHETARPHQTGLSDALMVQEWLVEGGITRFITLFDVQNLSKRLGPVRSLRPNLIEGALPWTRAFIYAGGSPEAYALLGSHQEVYDLNGLTGAAYGLFFRDDEIPAPHNLFISGSTLLEIAAEQELQTIAWQPYETGRPPTASSATIIDLEFYNRLHNITYKYYPLPGTYERKNGEVELHGQPVNVLIIAVPILGTGDFGRLNVPVRGKGPAILFSRGTVQRGYWKKADTEDPFEFVDANDKPLIFAPGQTWLTSLPTLERVSWR